MRKNTKCREPVVYWPPTVEDPNAGQPTYKRPVELAARWEDGQIQEVTGGDRVWSSTSQVHTVQKVLGTGAPELVIEEDGYVWRGPLSRVTDLVDPTRNPGAVRIRRVGRIPTRRNRQLFTTMYL